MELLHYRGRTSLCGWTRGDGLHDVQMLRWDCNAGNCLRLTARTLARPGKLLYDFAGATLTQASQV